VGSGNPAEMLPRVAADLGRPKGGHEQIRQRPPATRETPEERRHRQETVRIFFPAKIRFSINKKSIIFKSFKPSSRSYQCKFLVKVIKHLPPVIRNNLKLPILFYFKFKMQQIVLQSVELILLFVDFKHMVINTIFNKN